MRASFALILFTVLLVACSSASAENWPGWRGPRGDGTSESTSAPTVWNGETGENIAWKVPVPGSGHASPIIWDDRMFLSSCNEKTQERQLTCFDRHTGEILWQKTVLQAPLRSEEHTSERQSLAYLVCRL